MIPSAYEFRIAARADSAVVRKLDDLAFGPEGQRAEPGELEAGVDAGDIHVLAQDGVPVGYIHADTSRPGRIYVAGVGVRPERQGQGLGSALIDHMLELLGDERHRIPVITVTSPGNVPMLKALFRRGFSARWFLADYFGPGHHRFGCQLRSVGARSSESVLKIPISRLEQICNLMFSQTFLIQGITGVGATAEFELAPIRRSDFLPSDPPDHFSGPPEGKRERHESSMRENLSSGLKDGMW